MASLFDQLSRSITAVRIQTTVLPDIVITDPFAPGPPNPLLQRLKPRITLELLGGDASPIVIAPYGEPTVSSTDVREALSNVGAFLALGALVFALIRQRRRK